MNIENHLPVIEIGALQEEVFVGLNRSQKVISSKFFYDARGSELFNQITQLDEYYPSRTEMGILHSIADDLTTVLKGKTLVELGSGDASKISVLFNALTPDERGSTSYYPVDVSESALFDTARTLINRFPEVTVKGIVADFVGQLEKVKVDAPKVICFFGSTLGNFEEDMAMKLLHSIHDLMNPGDQLLLGLDRVKNQQILHSAYNDNQGVTAKFNLNILNHINTLTGSDFNLELFEHKAYYNPDKERIEMHLISLENQIVHGKSFPFPIKISKGETIHTENSHKYSKERITRLIDSSKFNLEEIYSDEKDWFSVVRLGV